MRRGRAGIKRNFPEWSVYVLYTHSHTHIYIYGVKKGVHGEEKVKTFFFFFARARKDDAAKGVGHSLDHFQTRGRVKEGAFPPRNNARRVLRDGGTREND